MPGLNYPISAAIIQRQRQIQSDGEHVAQHRHVPLRKVQEPATTRRTSRLGPLQDLPARTDSTGRQCHSQCPYCKAKTVFKKKTQNETRNSRTHMENHTTIIHLKHTQVSDYSCRNRRDSAAQSPHIVSAPSGHPHIRVDRIRRVIN